MKLRSAARKAGADAAAGERIDIGGAAAAILTIDGEDGVADADITTDPVELLPRLRSIDIDVGAEAERIDLVAPLLFEAAQRRQINQRDDVVGLSMKWPPRERTRTGGAGSLQEQGAAAEGVEPLCRGQQGQGRRLVVALGVRRLHRPALRGELSRPVPCAGARCRPARVGAGFWRLGPPFAVVLRCPPKAGPPGV